MAKTDTIQTDVVLVGAGLANVLLAWFLSKRHSNLKVEIYERDSALQQDRTWSFHEGDIQASQAFIAELVSARWSGYDVHFKSYSRTLKSAYCSIKPAHLQKKLESLPFNISFNCPVESVSKNKVRLADGRTINAQCIIDGRGAILRNATADCYQKFLGITVKLKNSHGLERPILMDATIQQKEGYRFIYVLPWTENELLIEDTRYSKTPHIDLESMTQDIRSYCLNKGWQIESILEQEASSLAIPLYPQSASTSATLRLGIAGGFFHPVTSYSLPDAVRLADRISHLPTLTSENVETELRAYTHERRFRNGFYYLLNRMMFLAAPDESRFKVFEHFYRLSESLIERFYAGETTFLDQVRILSGKPPVPLWPALRIMMDRRKVPT